MEIIKVWKIKAIWWGTFKWNDTETGKFQYDQRELSFADMGLSI